MTSRHRARLRKNGRRWCVGPAGMALLILLGVAGCSAPAAMPSPAAPSSEATSAPSTQATPGATASAPVPAQDVPEAAGTASPTPAADVLRKVQGALQALARSTPQPSREQVRASLSDAGIAPGAVEVSASRTPTGLAVDAVDAAVLSGGQCVMAQIRSGNLETSVLPVLTNGRCFIGRVDG